MPQPPSPSNGALPTANPRTPGPPNGSPRRNWAAFVLGSALLAVVWLVALPWVGARPLMQADLRRQQARGINPGAMFYTELEALPPIVRHVEQLRKSHPEAFWSPRLRSGE